MSESKVNIPEFARMMKRAGLAEVTIKNRSYILNHLVKLRADLTDPNSVNKVLTSGKFSPASKFNHIKTYSAFAKAFKISWQKPNVKYEPRKRFIPLESEIDQLISACHQSPLCAALLQMLKETGMKPSEVCYLKSTDLNTENSTVRVNNPKNGPRTLKISTKLLNMIKELQVRKEEYVFNNDMPSLKWKIERTKKELAETLQNSRFKEINFPSLRRWKITTGYEKTGNIYYLSRLMGFRSVRNTMHNIDFGLVFGLDT